ncbi:hypothetical protein Agabi119p4_7423 [Agaricus bisporus var. burnettii]|uniref:Uncharacterized protein n=1 Tax=Agaricus bisporus var. burnettii TaxID=192524 RepID=A0A8H7C865_AGABI|nr:hypothetical protein Agabi119p4_7423 [Agaricus bisporus var. burnettii]
MDAICQFESEFLVHEVGCDPASACFFLSPTTYKPENSANDLPIPFHRRTRHVLDSRLGDRIYKPAT